ncbi:intracellular hyphae protein 1 [Phlyctema vagabunda]|uniref:Intracellular hyphae protein 1 n=1 Tax=Phlyctema vagabunda TaxID=108571 RepID=A0ABR4PW73_9HELO
MYISASLLLAVTALVLPIIAKNNTAPTRRSTNGTSSARASASASCNIIANRTVVAGDDLASIAAAANVTLDQVRRDPDPGLEMPGSEPTAVCSNATATTYEAAAGDTLIIMAKERVGITLLALLAANPQIDNPDLVDVGDVINIPLCGVIAEGGETT